jgi:uncharacterized protein YndB with AHSA1/START domain
MLELLPDGVHVVRRVQANRSDAFDAWVNPARLRSWFGPTGTQVVDVSGDLEVGKAYRLRIRHQDGRDDELVWTFREISAPERLVFDWGLGASGGAPVSVVTIAFRDGGSFTEIELWHTAARSDEERQMFAAGWEGCFAGLELILHQVV